MEGKKKKVLNIFLWSLLAVVIVFVIVSSGVIKYKQDRLADLTSKNQQIEEKLEKE